MRFDFAAIAFIAAITMLRIFATHVTARHEIQISPPCYFSLLYGGC